MTEADAQTQAVLALERVLGESSVNTQLEALRAAERDESETATVLPLAVVHARSTEDVAAALRVCNEWGVAVVPRAAGTGRTGGSAVIVPSVVLDLTPLRQVKELDRDDMIAVVQPGVITGEFHALVEREGLFFPPDPQSAEWCTLGGNAAENAGGPRALKYGVTREYVLGAQVVLMDGTVLQTGRRTLKGVTGFDMTALFVGSEGTLGVFTELTVKLIAAPSTVATLLACFATAHAAGTAVSGLVRAGVTPRCAELLDAICCSAIREAQPTALPPNARAVLLIELDGTEQAVQADCKTLGNLLTDLGATEVLMAQDSSQRERLWSARKVMSRALRKRANFKLSEDIVVPRSKLGAMLTEVARIGEREQLVLPTYGHAGDGNLHVNVLWDSDSERPAVHRAVESLFRATLALGGTLSGEHGIGVAKREYLALEQSDALIDAQLAVKYALDPKGLLNPGKIFPSRGHRAC